ncbi:MAG: hypothetical protein K9I68_04960 [Bacteroidales bacterium]|nr:hypothetical protein [Bacteroidales bacterium]MCF8337787.1 hypothetical protein [Bacteroidales bacterium]
MNIKVIILIFVLSISYTPIFGQSNDLYLPVTINSPVFEETPGTKVQAGTKINNFGLHFQLASRLNDNVVIFSIQQNNGNIELDPLNFNLYKAYDQETHLIQSYPEETLYGELAWGRIFSFDSFLFNTHTLKFFVGIGNQIHNLDSRYFVQLDWGSQSEKFYAGLSVRGNYTSVQQKKLFTIEPALQGKIKLWRFWMVHQLGYSAAVKNHEDYMKPIYTVGLNYAFSL